MRILFLSQLIPYPADAGPKVRIFHVLQYLADAGHEITLVAFRRDGDTSEHIAEVGRQCKKVHTVLMRRSRARDVRHLAISILTGQPFLISRDSVQNMHRLVQEVMASQSFDAIHADQLWMAQYALAANGRNRQSSRPKIVLDQHNAVYLIPERLASATSNPLIRAFLNLESRKLARYERDTCRKFDQIVWVTQEDRKALAATADGKLQTANDLVIPICIDPEEKQPIPRSKKAKRVTFLGGMHWPPNAAGVTWFAGEVWPRIVQAVPEALFTVIGKNPPSLLTSHDSVNDNLDVPGYVENLERYLSETAVFVIPLQAGGGMRVKILDAWAWGLPVVSTRIGAEGLNYVDGTNLLIADQPESFATAVVSLLRDPELALKLASAGRTTVEADYDWRNNYIAWDKIYKMTNGTRAA